jgi:hypothetical protein
MAAEPSMCDRPLAGRTRLGTDNHQHARPDLPGPAAGVGVPTDVRWEKVHAVRDALARGQYDLDGLTRAMIEGLARNPGALRGNR